MNDLRKELRLGNFIQFNEFDFEDKLIEPNEKEIDDEDMCCLWDGCGLENIKPIPLTEEYLLKFGFTKIVDGNKYGYYKNIGNRCLRWAWGFEITIELSSDFYDFNESLYEVKIEFIHQLQNLYFSLTGEELTALN